MAFDFNTFGTTPETTTKKVSGFDFNSFGSTVDTSVAPQITADQKSAMETGALFPAKTGEGSVKAGFKALGNIPGSVFGLAKNIGSAVIHPLKTLEGIGRLTVGSVEKLVPGKQADEASFDTMAQFFKDRYGSFENLQRTATNDPFGFGTDVLAIISGGAGLAGKTAELSKGIELVGKAGIAPIAKTAETVTSGVRNTTKFGISQATGLNPETISNIIKDPKAFTPEALKETSRANLGTTVKEAIDTRLDNLSDIGSGYNTIKESPGQVIIPRTKVANPITPEQINTNKVFDEFGIGDKISTTKEINPVEAILEKYGIKVVDGKVKTTAEAKPLTSADKTALEDFINVYGNEPVLSNNAFLNARSGLSQLSKYDSAKTGNLTPIARELRGFYDELGKKQIKGLSELDATYAPEVRELNQIKKDYLTPTGEFKDGAINKIANLTGVGKEQVLNRLEKIVPGVTQRIKIVKAAEDIERSAGLKVGTYARAGLGIFGVSTANIPAIIAAIVASPEIAVRLLRAYGYTNKTAQPIIRALYGMANDVNNFRLPGMMQNYISEYLKNPKMGMSIEDVTRSQPELIPKSGKTEKIQSQVSSPKSTTKPSPESTLLQEAKKYETAEEFVKAQPTVYRGEGGSNVAQGKALLAEGKHYASDAEYPKGFGKVGEYTIKPNAKVLDLGDSTFAEISKKLGIPEKNYILPKELSKIAKEKGYDVLKYDGTYKSSGKTFNHTVDLTGDSYIPKSQLTDIWNKANGK